MAALGDEVEEIAIRMAASALAQSRLIHPSPQTTRDRLTAMAFHNAATSIASSIDHLRAVAIVASGRRIPTFALMTLVRTAHECALDAQWLLDDVDEEERVLRGVRVQYEDYTERRKFEQSSNRPPPSKGKLAADRLADLMRDAAALSLLPVAADGTIHAPKPPPNAVELFDLYESSQASSGGPVVKGQLFYRLMSGYAHGKQWATTIGSVPVGDRDTHGNGAARIIANDDHTYALMLQAARRLASAADAYLARR